MPDLAATNVTVTVEDQQIVGKQRRNLVKITFGDGALTYPANGVPMPTKEKFGMVRNLRSLVFYDTDDSNGLTWKYDVVNNKLRAWVQGYAHGAAGAVTMDDFPVTAAFGVKASMSVSLLGTDTGTAQLGGLVEASGGAPAAQTLYAEAIGW